MFVRMRDRTESVRHSIHKQMGLAAEEREFNRQKHQTTSSKTISALKQQGQEVCYKLPSSDMRQQCIKMF